MNEAAMDDNGKKDATAPLQSALPAEGWHAPAPTQTAPYVPKEPTGPVPEEDEMMEWLKPVQDPELF
ncbi:MAG TPA: hypothetical protein VL588_11985, partial [Bdellovibrionota bacterium]|nr:hypothetical protein [Bdellovibrionota bacterium]